MKIPELLAPVGSMDHLKVAINSGASSVYLSGKDYGARKYAENFTLDEINEAVDIAHIHNVKVYVTVNTLIKEDELSKKLSEIIDIYLCMDITIRPYYELIKTLTQHLAVIKMVLDAHNVLIGLVSFSSNEDNIARLC